MARLRKKAKKKICLLLFLVIILFGAYSFKNYFDQIPDNPIKKKIDEYIEPENPIKTYTNI